jgi:hypothetical protein
MEAGQVRMLGLLGSVEGVTRHGAPCLWGRCHPENRHIIDTSPTKCQHFTPISNNQLSRKILPKTLFSQLEEDIFVLNKIKHEQPGVVVLRVDTACAGYFGSG